MIAAAHILDCPDHQLRMVAEVLGCASPDPHKRREHRLRKIKSFPESEQAEVKRLVNVVLNERRKDSPYKGNFPAQEGEQPCSS